MKALTRKSDIIINNKKMRVGELITNLKSLPSSEVRDFFIKQKKMIPRNIRCEVLRKVIADKINSDKKLVSTLTDEMNYRLNWYSKFSEYQLENYIDFFKNPEFTDYYKEELWLAIVCRHDDLKIDDITIFTLNQKSINFRIESDVNEEFMEYNRTMDCIFYDEPGCLDNLKLSDFRENLIQSSTLVELREIGSKYGIDVPRRIKKNELMDIILDELKAKNALTPELEEKIPKMSVVALQRLAKDNGIKASIELKKEDIIEYIIKSINQPSTEGKVEDESNTTDATLVQPEVAEDKTDEVDYNSFDIADLFAPEKTDEVAKDPEVVVPDATNGVPGDEMFNDDMSMMDQPEIDMFGGLDMGMGMDGLDMMGDTMMDDTPQFEQTTESEGSDAMDGIDMADLDIFMPDSTGDAFFFDEAPKATNKPNNAFDTSFATPSDSDSQQQMTGFKNELNEFNRKLESLIAFQMKVLEKNNGNAPASSSDKKSDVKSTGDLFSTVQAEVKEEKINQARGLDELRKLAEANGGVMPGIKGGPIAQDSYLPSSKKEQVKESKKKAKERARRRKFMSAEELEFELELEKKEKAEMKRLRDAEKAQKENSISNHGMSLVTKLLITAVIIAIVTLIFLLVVYFLCKQRIVTDGFIREIYDFFRRLLGRTK